MNCYLLPLLIDVACNTMITTLVLSTSNWSCFPMPKTTERKHHICISLHFLWFYAIHLALGPCLVLRPKHQINILSFYQNVHQIFLLSLNKYHKDSSMWIECKCMRSGPSMFHFIHHAVEYFCSRSYSQGKNNHPLFLIIKDMPVNAKQNRISGICDQTTSSMSLMDLDQLYPAPS